MANRPWTNSGHGHVWARPDGLKARCGGPALCDACKLDDEILTKKHFAITAEIDYYYFLLSQTLQELQIRTPVDRLIDEAAGVDATRTKEVRRIVPPIKFLRGKINR